MRQSTYPRRNVKSLQQKLGRRDPPRYFPAFCNCLIINFRGIENVTYRLQFANNPGDLLIPPIETLPFDILATGGIDQVLHIDGASEEKQFYRIIEQ